MKINNKILLLGLPINTKDLGIGVIYQPKIINLVDKDIVKLLYPYSLSLDLFNNIKDYNVVSIYDLFFLKKDKEFFFKNKNNEPIIYDLIDSLKLFYNTENVILNFEKQIININNSINITRYNFDLLSEIILQINLKQKIKKEEDKKKKFLGKRQKAIYEKIMKNRERYAKKNELLIEDMIALLVHNNIRPFSYKEVTELTYWQLVYSYKQIINIISYETYIKYQTSMKFDVKENKKHWLETIKFIKEPE